MKLAYRLHRPAKGTTCFDSVTDLIRAYPDCFDEVCVFTDLSEHGYETPEHMRENAAVLTRELAALRAAGVKRVGLNVLNTIGQNDDGWDWVDPVPFQTMVGRDGSVCRGSMCMRSPGVREYVREKYRIYAACDPDYLWVDDDMRMYYHKVEYPCFCETCVRRFGKLRGVRYTRESLTAALDREDPALRRAWMRYNADELCDTLRAAAEAAREVKPKLEFGLMTTDIKFNAYSMENVRDMLTALDAKMLRPGGGFWNCGDMEVCFRKMFNVAGQIFEAGGAEDVQYESENIPSLESKPPRIHRMEMTAALFAGCTGVIVDNVRETEPASFRRLLETLRFMRPTWEKLTDFLPGTSLRGGRQIYRTDVMALRKGSFWCQPDDTENFFTKGFCYTYEKDFADYALLSGCAAECMTDGELGDLLRGPVVMDSLCAKTIVERGLGKLIGCAAGNWYTNGIREYELDHPMNDCPGAGRGGAQSQFRGERGLYLARALPGAEVLSEVRSTTGDFVAEGTFLWENALGGRTAVLNYVPWAYYDQPCRVEQVRRILTWLTRGNEGLRMEGLIRAQPMLRVSAEGDRFALLLVNASYDESEPGKISVAGAFGPAEMNVGGRDLPRIPARRLGGRTEYEIPPIGPWDFAVLLGRRE